MEYTVTDVLVYWNQIKPPVKTRVRHVLDPRNYIVALLYYKFNITEIELESIMEMDRSSVNHAKRHPYNLIKISEPTFMRNTEEVREKFPYDFPSSDKEDKTDERYIRKYSYTLSFDKKMYQRIKTYSRVKELDPRTALRNLVIKALALWEE